MMPATAWYGRAVDFVRMSLWKHVCVRTFVLRPPWLRYDTPEFKRWYKAIPAYNAKIKAGDSLLWNCCSLGTPVASDMMKGWLVFIFPFFVEDLHLEIFCHETFSNISFTYYFVARRPYVISEEISTISTLICTCEMHTRVDRKLW